MVSSNPIFHRPWSLASFDFKNLTATPTYIDDVRTALPAMWFANMDRQNARRNWGRFFGTKNTVVLFLLCVGWWGGGHARCIDMYIYNYISVIKMEIGFQVIFCGCGPSQQNSNTGMTFLVG